jgi:acetyl esterase/lipase
VNRQNVEMAYFVALASGFLVLSAGTALRPGRRGLFSALAFPVGWAAGELPGQGIVVEGLLLGLLWWWGWPTAHWLGLLVLFAAGVVVLENVGLIAILFRSRSIVRRAMRDAPVRPLEIPRPADDAFGAWWRTALQIPLHPRDMQLTKNVEYGPLPRQRLDVWRTSTTPQDAPVIFYLHGGSWTFGDKREQGRPMLHEFVRRGWVVVSCNYRLAPRSPWPAQIEDATRALGWIKQNVATYGGDPTRVVVAGASAGGQLAALLALSAKDPSWRPREMAGVTDWTIRGALVFYGVLEMTGNEEYWRGLGRGLLYLLERKVVQMPFVGNEVLYQSLSPYDRMDVDAPPFFVVQGVNDTLVDVHVARGFVEKFRRVAFAPMYYIELPFTQHSFDLTASPRTSATTRAAVAFAERVAAPRPSLSPELVASYQVPPTELRVNVGGQWRDAHDVAREWGPFFVVTSDNPFSRVITDEENATRRGELRRLLEAHGLAFRESRARDTTGRWPDELGVALAGISREEAQALAAAWEQSAFYEVGAEMVVVRATDTDEALV